MKKAKIYIWLLAAFSCTSSIEKNDKFGSFDDEIWFNDHIVFHFKKGVLNYEIDDVFHKYQVSHNMIIVENSDMSFDTIRFKMEDEKNMQIEIVETNNYLLKSKEKRKIKLAKFSSINDSVEFVSFESTPCLGQCPVQTLLIKDDTLYWKGISNLGKIGFLEIPVSNMKDLSKEINDRLMLANLPSYQVSEFHHTEDTHYYIVKFRDKNEIIELKFNIDSSMGILYFCSYLSSVYTFL